MHVLLKNCPLGFLWVLLGVVMGGCAGVTERSLEGNLRPPALSSEQVEILRLAETPRGGDSGPNLPTGFLVAAEEPGESLDPAEAVVSEEAAPGEEQAPSDEEFEDEFYDPFAEGEGEEGEEAEFEEYDPWEPYNVVVFRFNYSLDKYLVKPVAKGYNFIMPNVVQRGIFNIFHNLVFGHRLLNNLFQGKLKGAGIELGSFLVNSTVGIGGFFDPAEDWLEWDTPDEDFGQTLGYYGVGPGPYLLLPFWPSPLTVRDGIGYVVDLFLEPVNWFLIPMFDVEGLPTAIDDPDASFALNWGLRVFDVLNQRSLNLEAFQGVEEATVDLYSATRNGYLQRRAKAIQE